MKQLHTKKNSKLEQQPAIVKGAQKRKLASHEPMVSRKNNLHKEPSISSGATRKLESVKVPQGGGGKGSDIFNHVMKKRGY